MVKDLTMQHLLCSRWCSKIVVVGVYCFVKLYAGKTTVTFLVQNSSNTFTFTFYLFIQQEM
jgi:hypothetical protein